MYCKWSNAVENIPSNQGIGEDMAATDEMMYDPESDGHSFQPLQMV